MTTEELIKDQVFLSNLRQVIVEVKERRKNRPEPKPGYYYKRDWFDRIERFDVEYCTTHIIDIWEKKSDLSSEIRSIINYVCSKAAYLTEIHYNNQTHEPTT